MHGKENWIDFENEISNLIQSLHMDMYEKGNVSSMYEEIGIYFSNDFLENYTNITSSKRFGIYKDIKDKLYNDLNKLIKALEIYLYYYVNKIKCEKKSPDIQEIIANKDTCIIIQIQ